MGGQEDSSAGEGSRWAGAARQAPRYGDSHRWVRRMDVFMPYYRSER